MIHARGHRLDRGIGPRTLRTTTPAGERKGSEHCPRVSPATLVREGLGCSANQKAGDDIPQVTAVLRSCACVTLFLDHVQRTSGARAGGAAATDWISSNESDCPGGVKDFDLRREASRVSRRPHELLPQRELVCPARCLSPRDSRIRRGAVQNAAIANLATPSILTLARGQGVGLRACAKEES
jgi:hypothetical protein